MDPPDRFPPSELGVRDHPRAARRVIEERVKRVGHGQDENRRQQELDEPERDREVRARKRELHAPRETSGRGEATSHHAIVSESIRFCIQKTARAVQREAARGSA